MHSTQQSILELATSQNLYKLSLREIGKAATGKDQPPQLVKYHLQRLIDGGHLRVDERHGVIERVVRGEKHASFVPLPIVGAASCGPATQIAEQHVEGYLCLSQKFLPKDHSGLFVVRAVGSSMNCAQVKGKAINDGDFVVVDSKARQPESGSYVLAVTGGNANVKKFVKDADGQAMLLSESSENFSPIYIHPEDQTDFFINGCVVDVFKKPQA